MTDITITLTDAQRRNLVALIDRSRVTAHMEGLEDFVQDLRARLTPKPYTVFLVINWDEGPVLECEAVTAHSPREAINVATDAVLEQMPPNATPEVADAWVYPGHLGEPVWHA